MQVARNMMISYIHRLYSTAGLNEHTSMLVSRDCGKPHREANRVVVLPTHE